MFGALFGSCDVEKVHAVVARSTFRSQNVQDTSAPDHFWRFRFAWQAQGIVHLVQSEQSVRLLWHFQLQPPLHHITLQYATLQLQLHLHYIPLHYNTTTTTPSLHSTTLHSATLRYTTLHSITFKYTTLHYITLHYTTLHSTTLHYTTLRSTTPRYITLQLHYTTLHTTLHYTKLIALHYATLYYTTLPHIALHYITLHSLHHTKCNCNYTKLITLHHNYNSTITTTTAALHPTTSSSCGWGDRPTRWPLQPLQPLQKTQLQPSFGPSVDSLCHPWFIRTNLSYRFPIFETSAAALCGTTGIQLDVHMLVQSFRLKYQTLGAEMSDYGGYGHAHVIFARVSLPVILIEFKAHSAKMCKRYWLKARKLMERYPPSM